MNSVEDIYLSKLSRFHSVLQQNAAKSSGASAAFADILDAVEQRLAIDSEESAGPSVYDASSFVGYSSDLSYSGVQIGRSNAEIDAAVSRAAYQTGLDPALIYAVIQTESSFRPDAVSSAGAQGLMQLMPGTAVSVGVTDSFDIYQNVRGGSMYLSQLLERFGDVRLALAAYNTGPGRIGRLGITNADDPQQYEQISQRVRNYVDRVLKYYEMYKSR